MNLKSQERTRDLFFPQKFGLLWHFMPHFKEFGGAYCVWFVRYFFFHRVFNRCFGNRYKEFNICIICLYLCIIFYPIQNNMIQTLMVRLFIHTSRFLVCLITVHYWILKGHNATLFWDVPTGKAILKVKKWASRLIRNYWPGLNEFDDLVMHNKNMLSARYRILYPRPRSQSRVQGQPTKIHVSVIVQKELKRVELNFTKQIKYSNICFMTNVMFQI